MRRWLRAALRRHLDRIVKVEVIGQDECPMMLRWEFLNLGLFKVMVHYFPPEVSDRDPHDHPRSFVTLILRGRYFDTSWQDYGLEKLVQELECIEAGRLIYRSAKHTHIVETDEVGCWSLVIMGPLQREWGFLRQETGEWWPWGKYVQRFGGVMRCEPARPEPTYRDYKGTHPSL